MSGQGPAPRWRRNRTPLGTIVYMSDMFDGWDDNSDEDLWVGGLSETASGDGRCRECGGNDPTCAECSGVVHVWDEVIIDGHGSGLFLCNAEHDGQPCDQTRIEAAA